MGDRFGLSVEDAPGDERRDNKRLLEAAAPSYLFFSVPCSSIKSAKRSHDSS